MTVARGVYFEDVSVGDVTETPAMTLTQAHVSLYLGLSGESSDDPGEVPPLLPLALSTGLGWRVPTPPLVVTAFVGFDWEIVKPLRVGDTMHSRARTASKRSMRDAGIVVEEHEIVDQRGETAQRGRFTFLVAKRSAVETAAGR
jgi:acyl dehydratase